MNIKKAYTNVYNKNPPWRPEQSFHPSPEACRIQAPVEKIQAPEDKSQWNKTSLKYIWEKNKRTFRNIYLFRIQRHFKITKKWIPGWIFSQFLKQFLWNPTHRQRRHHHTGKDDVIHVVECFPTDSVKWYNMLVCQRETQSAMRMRIIWISITLTWNF